MRVRMFAVLVAVLVAQVVAVAQEHSVKVTVEVKPAGKPGVFARMFARKEAAPVMTVPLQAIQTPAQVAALTALVAGPGVPAKEATAAKVPTVEVRVNK